MHHEIGSIVQYFDEKLTVVVIVLLFGMIHLLMIIYGDESEIDQIDH
jgi:hypothetical protein